MSEQGAIQLRLFGVLRGRRMNRIEKQTFPFSPNLTVGKVLSELQSCAEPASPLATLHRDALLVLVNGRPIQHLDGWDTLLSRGDTLTLMVKAFGG